MILGYPPVPTGHCHLVVTGFAACPGLEALRPTEKKALSQGHVDSDQGPDPDFGLSNPLQPSFPLHRFPVEPVPLLFRNHSTSFLLPLKQSLQQRPAPTDS